MTRSIAILVLVVSLASCASPTPSTPPSGTPSSPAPGTTDQPTIDPAWLGAPAYTCGGDVQFPPAALAGPTGAESGSDDPARILRSEIQGSPPEVGLPVGGWRRVLDTAETVLFVGVGDGSPRWFQVELTRDGAGWMTSTVGQCDLRVAFPDETLTVADWWPDPTIPFDPDATSLAILVLERACASGQDATGRIQPPAIASTPEAVVVVVAVRQREGGQDCQGNPPTPFTLELPEPLGGRPLFDGGTVPPREPVPTG